MVEVHLNRFEARYRLPTWALAEQGRLDQLRTRALDKAFAQVLDHTGMAEDGELCIRYLVAPVCLRLSGTDESLTSSWSLAIAEEIVRAIRNGANDNVVFFHSRRQALQDLAIGTARGDLRRVWVWRQLGLWRSSYASSRDVSNQSQAIFELVTALCAESALLIPTLRALAEAGWLSRIVHRLTAQQWETLALAALREVRATHVLEESREVPSPVALRNALRVVNRSRLLWAFTSTGSVIQVGAAARRALAALSVLDVEPVLLSTATAPVMIGIIADGILAPRHEIMQSLPKPAVPAPTKSEVTRPEPGVLDVAQDLVKPASSAQLQPDNGGPEESIRPDNIERATADSGQIEHASEFWSAAESVSAPGEDVRKPIDLRQRALTRFGGLLFLLGIIDDLQLPEEILHDVVLGARPFCWVIHQMGLALIAMEANDPAALAFAGLPPRAIPPSTEEEPPNDMEAAALNLLVARILEQLRVALEHQDDPEGTLAEQVCCRCAEVVADPGWIELRFALDDVATEIRRAGLDLDPGYVPWLGLVVRFVYE